MPLSANHRGTHMANLFQNPDGANGQARAVLAYLSMHDGIEQSWSAEWKRYLAEPQVDRWHNCREQGYVVTLKSEDYSRQINIVFFEHRNSDEICAVEWEGRYLNPPTINDIPKTHPYCTDKFAVSHHESWGDAQKMAEWIFIRLTDFWKVTAKAKAA